MGFISPEPLHRPHYCDRPTQPRMFKEGTRWQCDTCSKVYRIEPVTDRNITAPEWVEQPRKATGPRGAGEPYQYKVL